MNTGRFRDGFRSGVVATLAMSVPMALTTLAKISPLPRPIPVAVVRNVLGADAPKPLVAAAALVMHFTYGGTWGGLLAASSRRVSTRKGVGLGVALWIVLGVAFAPWLGWGRFGREESPKVAPATLLPHLIYGVTVGTLLSRDEETDEPRNRPAAAADAAR